MYTTCGYNVVMQQHITKEFLVEKKGKQSLVILRQMAHDPQYKVGSHIPGYGKVVAVKEGER